MNGQSKTHAEEISVSGRVQGVGFRPFVFRLARECALNGVVRNVASDVWIHVEGAAVDVERFVVRLHCEAPPLAMIRDLTRKPVLSRSLRGFEIDVSTRAASQRLEVGPDSGVCDECRQDMEDPENRRYLYPFTTCTNCGPRFTVIDKMPYDRERTSMRVFPMCEQCSTEYHDPASRRFHSETNCCSQCGPRIWMEGAAGNVVALGNSVFTRAAADLNAAGIVALRGLGGFHLAVDATCERAVARLRARKQRHAKPLAVMVADVAAAREFAEVSDAEAELLESPASPIVLVRKRENSCLADGVSPGLEEVGVVLAYTPLHLLLTRTFGRPMVMTSGNLSEEPIAITNEEARAALSTVADCMILHDREILARYDDSVVRVQSHGPVSIRRSRGYAPEPLELLNQVDVPLIAVGPHLKNTFTLATGRSAYVSQHIGDLENLETLDHFTSSVSRLSDLFEVRPRIAVRDMHPGYLSSRLADEMDVERVIDVQHHHAHIAAVAGEHGITKPVVGLAFDGTGYGEDGAIWGAEVLISQPHEYRRLAHLRYIPLPGGDLAARNPWRSALGVSTLDSALPVLLSPAFNDIEPRELELARRQLARGLNSPFASSMGRLFDAAAALLGVRQVHAYEGQAAMELETLAGNSAGELLPFPLIEDGESMVMDPAPLFEELARRLAEGRATNRLAADFHDSVAATAVDAAVWAARVCSVKTIALGGGVFANSRLTTSIRTALERDGFEVILPRMLGPGDGAISYGQAVVAAAMLAREKEGARCASEYQVA